MFGVFFVKTVNSKIPKWWNRSERNLSQGLILIHFSKWDIAKYHIESDFIYDHIWNMGHWESTNRHLLALPILYFCRVSSWKLVCKARKILTCCHNGLWLCILLPNHLERVIMYLLEPDTVPKGNHSIDFSEPFTVTSMFLSRKSYWYFLSFVTHYGALKIKIKQ